MASRRKQKKKIGKKNNQKLILLLDIMIVFIGVALILDGTYSIYLQMEDPLIFHLGRIVRTIFGIVLIIVGTYAYRMNNKRKF